MIPLLQANFRPRIRLNYPTHVTKILAGSGTLSVTPGQELTPDTILGKYYLPAGFSSINLSRKLNIPPKSISKYLQKPLGSKIYQGELLALKKGLFSKTLLTSPNDGILDNINDQTGEVRIKYFTKEKDLTSGVYGIVDYIDKTIGSITIKTFVNEINCVLGAGKQRTGLLKIIKNPSNLTKVSQISPDMAQSIVVTGALIDYEALMKVYTLGIYGIISGGVNFSSYKPLINKFSASINLITDVGVTIVVSEGFGAVPIGEDIYNLLLSYEGQFIYVSGTPPRVLLPCASEGSIIQLRKIVLPAPVSPAETANIDIKNIEVGAKVRIIWPPFFGSTGQVIAIDQSVTKLESGIDTYLLTIETHSRKIKVPYPNIELI